MGPVSVVPFDEEADLAAEGFSIQRHEDATQRRALHGSHQPLGGQVVRSALSRDGCHPGILDAHLLLNKEEFLGEPGNPSRAGSAELACPRAVVRASRARDIAWTAADRTIWGQFLGSCRG